MSKPKGIMPAFVYPPYGVPQLFMESMHHSYKSGVFQHDWVANVGSRPNQARTLNGQAFLRSNAEYIFLVDTDMVWEPDAIITLRQFAESRKKKMVAGWALMTRNGMWPNAFKAIEDGDYKPWGDIQPFAAPLRVDAVGGSCLLVHRDVYEKLAENTDTDWPWQDDLYNPITQYTMGEDLGFSKRVTEAGFEIWYHPQAIFTHVKQQQFGPREYTAFIKGLLNHGNIHTADL